MIENWLKDEALPHDLRVLLWLCEHADNGYIVVENKAVTIPPGTQGLFLVMRKVLTDDDIHYDDKVRSVTDMFVNFDVRSGGNA